MSEPGLLVTTIEPASSHWLTELGELPRYRNFLFILLWRDIKVRYKQSVLGIGWAIAQPIILMVVFSVVFGTVAQVPSEGVPYPVFSYAGLLPWLLFQKALVQGSTSLVSFKSELTKIYFPRIAAPLVAFMSAAVDFAITLVILVVMLAYYHVPLRWQLVLIPVLAAYAGLAALSFVLWLSAVNVEYRDVQHVIPFLAQVWMFVTPVVYPASLLPQKYAQIYWLNPMASVVETFRWAILGTPLPPAMAYVLSFGLVVITGVTGMRYFSRVARTMADRV